MIKQWGYDVDLWDAGDYGVPTLGLTYVTSEDTIKSDPEMLGKFMKAALEGIRYAEQHPDEAVEYVLKYAGPETDRDHMKFMLMSELNDLHSNVTDQYGIGYQTHEQWQSLEDMLVKYETMQKIDVDAAFTNDFLPK